MVFVHDNIAKKTNSYDGCIKHLLRHDEVVNVLIDYAEPCIDEAGVVVKAYMGADKRTARTEIRWTVCDGHWPRHAEAPRGLCIAQSGAVHHSAKPGRKVELQMVADDPRTVNHDIPGL